ncbi:MAG: aspartate/glutamate racemase family protein [Aestuariivita sp.]|nr:aspartate/glutamate racemase family protein [Aestuariivita sp.]MCY4346720.1 aspartate/glutamate racemase family protein [Aestuariivita sp.]
MAIGIFDSGLGGLTVLAAAEAKLPNQEFLYFADSAHAPYGERDPEDIYRLTKEAVMILWDQGCDLVILACNTASAVALRRMQEDGVPNGKRVLGVFVPLIEALTERHWGDNSPPREVAINQVALFATPATVASRAFQRELAFRAIGVDVESRACHGLVDAIENGSHELAKKLVWSHVEALKRKMPTPQAAILGCTHYPLLSSVFATALGPNIRVFSQAGIVAESLANYLHRRPSMTGGGAAGFVTTGETKKTSEQATRVMRRQIHFTRA